MERSFTVLTFRMGFSLNISPDAELALREAFGADMDRAALEAMVIMAYRMRKFGISGVRRSLGLSTRMEAEQWLGNRGVAVNYGPADFDDDLGTMRRVLGNEVKSPPR